MKRLVLASLSVICMTTLATASDTRTLTGSVPAGSLEGITLNASIGDVDIEAVEGLSEVRIEVLLTPRRGGLFSSKRRAEEEVRQARLSSEVRGSRLELTIAPQADEDRRFEEDWQVQMPPGLMIDLDHGVGDIKVRGTTAAVEIEAGVGDINLEVLGGDISVALGVGTAVVEAPSDPYGSVECAGGVGDARLTVDGEEIDGRGFVGDSASWQGSGAYSLEVAVGVGDAIVELD
jgi:hypothetical protein